MKKLLIILLALVISGVFFLNEASAAHKCWQLTMEENPSMEVYLDVSVTNSGYKHKILNGTLYTPGFWLFAVVGTWEKHPDGVNKIVSLHTSGLFTFGYEHCILEAIIDKVTKEGPYIFTCDHGTDGFHGNFVKVPCKTIPSASSAITAPSGSFKSLLGQP